MPELLNLVSREYKENKNDDYYYIGRIAADAASGSMELYGAARA